MPSTLSYYTFKSCHLPLSPTPTQHLSNKVLNLLLSYVLYFAYYNECCVFDLVRNLECREFFPPAWWSFYLSSTMNHWHYHWQRLATSILRCPRESYDSGSGHCKIKCTWAFLIFLALEMWLTWYQVVDHVCNLQSNMAKGMCSIDDSLNKK